MTVHNDGISLDIFPNEIQAMFFEHLNGRQRLGIQRVCFGWKNLIDELFVNEEFKTFTTLNDFQDEEEMDGVKKGKIDRAYRVIPSDCQHNKKKVKEIDVDKLKEILDKKKRVSISKTLEVNDEPDDEEKIEALLKILRENNFDSIEFDDIECSKHFNTFFIKHLENDNGIKNLSFIESNFDFDSLSESEVQLDSLRLEKCGIYMAGCNRIAKIISSNIVSRSLNLCTNSIYGDGFSRICEALEQKGVTLQSLDLSENLLGSDDIDEIADTLKINNSLKYLKIGPNYNTQGFIVGVKEYAISNLAEALKTNTTLEELDLADCFIGDAGVKCLAEALKVNQHLRCLNLGENKITEEGIKELCSALIVNKSIVHLNLSSNNLSDQSVSLLTEALKTNKFLKKINLKGNFASKKMLDRLQREIDGEPKSPQASSKKQHFF